MTIAARSLSTVLLAGVCFAHMLHGRSWILGWGILGLMLVWKALGLGLKQHKSLPRVLTCVLGSISLGALLLQTFKLLVDGGYGRFAGWLPHPNIAAATALSVLALLSATTSLSGERGRARRVNQWSLIVGVLVAIPLVVASGSRSVMLGALIGFLVVLFGAGWKKKGFRRWFPAFGILMLVGTLGSFTILRQDLSNPLDSLGRSTLFATSLRISILSPWIGLGDGAWQTYSAEIEPSLPISGTGHAHSLPLTLLMEGGSLGLAAVLVMFSTVIWSGLIRRRRFRTPNNSVFWVCVLGLASQSLVDLTLVFPTVYAPLVAAALLIAIDRPETSPHCILDANV